MSCHIAASPPDMAHHDSTTEPLPTTWPPRFLGGPGGLVWPKLGVADQANAGALSASGPRDWRGR